MVNRNRIFPVRQTLLQSGSLIVQTLDPNAIPLRSAKSTFEFEYIEEREWLLTNADSSLDIVFRTAPVSLDVAHVPMVSSMEEFVSSSIVDSLLLSLSELLEELDVEGMMDPNQFENQDF